MSGASRLTRGRRWLLAASLALNAFLLLKVVLLTASFVGSEYMCRGFIETVDANKPVGLALLSMLEKELRGREKQEVLNRLESIYDENLEFAQHYKDRFMFDDGDKAEGKDCTCYGGAFLIFRDEKFVSFDTDFKCTSARYSYEFHK